jgi:hypothetical protein
LCVKFYQDRGDVFIWVGSLAQRKNAQHSVHPTGGSLRVFKHFAWLEVGSDKIASSRLAHQRVTQAVGRNKPDVVAEMKLIKQFK